MEGDVMGIEERAVVVVAQFTLLHRVRKVRSNATAGVGVLLP